MSQSVRCEPVESKRDQRQFLQFETEIYEDDPNWVMPLWMNRKALLGFSHHPFYDDADCQAFLARRGDKVVGRVLAIVNHAHNRRYDEKRGFFGFFEAVDDEAVGIDLFTAATGWLKDQGMTDVRGPANPSLNYEVGLLVDGFDTPPTFMIPHNHNYYGRLIEAAGFEKTQDLYSYDAHVDMLQDLDPKLKFIIIESAKRFDVKCRPLDKSRFKEDVRTFLEIYNLSLERTWGYVPLSKAEIDQLAKDLRYLIVPELTSIAEIDGRPVGAGFGLLDYNQVLKKMNGRLLPFGWWKLLSGKKSIDRVRFISTNVIPEYQKWGVGLVTLVRILPDLLEYGVKVGEFSWVLESNTLSRGTIERGGARRIKVHRLYDMTLTRE